MVDSGASMHMISRKDLNSAELETVKVSRIPITVVTANGEVQTHEEATVYVKELDRFLTVKNVKNTPAVLSLGKLCEDHGYSHEWTSGQKPCLIKNGVRTQCNTENYFPIVVPGLSTTSSSSSSSGSTPRKHQYRRKVHGQHLFQHQLNVGVQMSKDGGPRRPTQSKSQNLIIMWITSRYGATRLFTKYPDGCKNSERILWMKESLSKRVLLICPLWSRRDEWYHGITVFTRTSRKTEIARSARGVKLQGHHAEDVLVKSYLVQKNCGDSITADHKILGEGCESRNNHRYAVVVQDLATQ